jgi:F0F1-type ATP synthase membrane subunit b/b'
VVVTEGIPGLCERFEDACEEAESVRDRAVQNATRQREHIVNSISGGRVQPSERLKAALGARCAGKVKDAEEQCEAACRSAQKEFFEALDRLEARD